MRCDQCNNVMSMEEALDNDGICDICIGREKARDEKIRRKIKKENRENGLTHGR